MTAIELRDALIEQGIASVKKHEKRSSRLRGGLAGFELCRLLDTPEQFLALLKERHEEEHNLIRARVPKEDYWEYRMATEQIEFVWERIRAALRIGKTFGARAVIHVYELMQKATEHREDA